MTEEVPEDAPPAVLFRLSYRTNDSYRSGHRPDDAPGQIVESMRGWWELDPNAVRDLGIAHAVAFHKRTTLAVVRIEGWKWLRTEADEHHTLPVDDLGRPMSDFNWAKYDDRIRWAFEISEDPVADETQGAWIGDGGKLVPARLRHTITSYWPASPDDEPRDLLGKALGLLGRALRPALEREFLPDHGSTWHDKLRRAHNINENFGGRMPEVDPSVNIQILMNESELAKRLVPSAKGALGSILKARNDWAHFEDIADRRAHAVVGVMKDLLTDLRDVDARAQIDSIHRALKLKIRGH